LTSTLVSSTIFFWFTPILKLLLTDGIVNVGAKDKATGKDQSMTVASSSGLNDKDIERMVEDAEKFADEDKARKNVIEMANKADSFCADTDKGTVYVF
jgi:molecular chaperone DnaK